VRILARDVSLARAPMTGTSILNTLPAVVVDRVDDAHPALTLVKLRVGESYLLARLTRRSAHALELEPGQSVYAQIKAVALIG
jgi:molybdate transport system ATP-binding protein